VRWRTNTDTYQRPISTRCPTTDSTGARWFDKAYTDDNLFLTLACQPEVLRVFLDWTAFIYTDKSSLDPAMVELCRIRLAHRNHGVH